MIAHTGEALNDRYARQTIIKQIGSKGQSKLARSSVIVIGAGGLGSPVLVYLAMAGIGRLGIVDSDTAALSNLNRQFLHYSNDIGRSKADSAGEKLSRLNNEIEIIRYNERLTDLNAKKIITGYDIIIGAADSFETRSSINRACVSLNLPYIDGGINEFSGCIMFSNPPDTPCLNCIFPEKRIKTKTYGVIGTTAGLIGTIQANTALLTLLEMPNPLINKLLIYDGQRMSINYTEIKRNEKCPVCSPLTGSLK